SERGDTVLHGGLRSGAERDHGNDSRDADDDAKHRQHRAQLVGAQRAERYRDRFAEEHGSLSPSASAAARIGAAAAATTTRPAAGTRAGVRRQARHAHALA